MENVQQCTPVPQNAFDAVSIGGLVFHNVDGVRTEPPANLHRMSPPIDLVDIYPHPDIVPFIYARPADECNRPEGPPVRQPSTLPAPGHSTLSLSLGDAISSGRSGVVYEALDVHIDSAPTDVPGDTVMGHLPPLVVKIARQNRCMSVVREAWFYEEMECLQGASIARCYGCFELRLEKGWRVGLWEDPQHRLYDTGYDSIPEFAKYPPVATMEAGIEPHPLLTELIMARNRVFVLVLERLGDELSAGYLHPASVQQDVKDIYNDMASLGITLASDVRSNNILAAPPSPPGLPSIPSPFTQRTYASRLVDFELARKTPWMQKVIARDQQDWVRNMFVSLPMFMRKRNRTTTPAAP